VEALKVSAQAEQETFSFQAEVVQLLDLMIHSLYSNREIFLRELISNAADAADRLRLETAQRPELGEDTGPAQIRVEFDPAARTITVSDNGVGMSRQEVIEHIGTIARSGTREFLEALGGDVRKDAALIGQFGVGFYASFVVADRVTLVTRRAGLPAGAAVRWESDGRGQYSLQPAERDAPGTDVVLHVRNGEDDLLRADRLRSIIQKYSDHISLPILMRGQAPAEPAEPASETVINQGPALWTRPKPQISKQEYDDFYQHLTNDSADPLACLHAKIEGSYEYTLLLYIPATAPLDLWMAEPGHGVKLHVQRVFITADADLLMPAYLRFVRGVIDSSDLPLNVSREMLQSSRAVAQIRATAVRKVLRLLADLAEHDPATYAVFWRQFGAVLKEGVAEDYASLEQITPLLRFTSTASATDEQDVSLADYLARRPAGQHQIYYLLAPSLAAARESPHLEMFRKKGIEVLLLSEPVDGWVVNSLQDVDGTPLRSVAQGTFDIGALADESEMQAQQQAVAEFAALLDRMRAVLDGKVRAVRVTGRLTSSPVCLVAGEPGRLPARQVQPVLEINPEHPLVGRLNTEGDDQRFADWTHVLYNQAVLTTGSMVDDPAGYAGRLNNLLLDLISNPIPPAMPTQPGSRGR
jgi:molecular chaperone HtpG